MIKYIDGKTFREDGYLQEANRCFFHPLGLALELDLDFGTLRVWDYRDDLEGIRFEGCELTEKQKRLQDIVETRTKPRMEALGYWIQPTDNKHTSPLSPLIDQAEPGSDRTVYWCSAHLQNYDSECKSCEDAKYLNKRAHHGQ